MDFETFEAPRREKRLKVEHLEFSYKAEAPFFRAWKLSPKQKKKQRTESINHEALIFHYSRLVHPWKARARALSSSPRKADKMPCVFFFSNSFISCHLPPTKGNFIERRASRNWKSSFSVAFVIFITPSLCFLHLKMMHYRNNFVNIAMIVII